MEIIKGFPATSQNNAQLNVIHIIKHAARNFGRQELVTRKPDGTTFRHTLISHPAILDAAVVGIAHPKWGERPLALVVLCDKVDAQEIRDHLAKRFARWQLPDEVLFVQAIPRTSVGKIDKKVIRAQYKGEGGARAQ